MPAAVSTTRSWSTRPTGLAERQRDEVSALPEALPLALGAAVYPPALLVLLLFTSRPEPRPRVLAYFAGAALLTLGAGLFALGLLSGAGLTAQDSRSASACVYLVVGLLLLAVADWAWRQQARERGEAAGAIRTGRLAEWSEHAATSRSWAFFLGLVMFLPSPMYLLAVKGIADSGDSTPSKMLAVAICAIGVLLFVEVTLVAMFIVPGGVASGLGRVHGWLGRNGWTLVAALGLIGGIYAIVKGIDALV
jgi:hypothetical protein